MGIAVSKIKLVEDREMMRALLRTTVVEALAELTGCSAETISDTDDLVSDLGLDSMGAVNLIIAIEDRAGRTLPKGYESSLVDVPNVAALVDRLASAFASVEGGIGASRGVEPEPMR